MSHLINMAFERIRVVWVVEEMSRKYDPPSLAPTHCVHLYFGFPFLYFFGHA